MTDLVIGFATAGRPKTFKRCVNHLSETVDLDYSLAVFDNSPSINQDVIDSVEIDLLMQEEESIGPGEARQLIADQTSSEYLLLIDDDTLPYPGAVSRLLQEVQSGDVRMASGVFYKDGGIEDGRSAGRILKEGYQKRTKTLYDIPIPPEGVVDHNVTALDVDIGMPMILLDREIFEIASFDSRYDWFYEWIDFFYQTWQHDEPVRSLLTARFEHLDGEYTGQTISREQKQSADRRRFCDKYSIELNRDYKMTRIHDSESAAQQAAYIYATQGSSGLINSGTEFVRDRVREFFD